jgi:hypothetical protein
MMKSLCKGSLERPNRGSNGFAQLRCPPVLHTTLIKCTIYCEDGATSDAIAQQECPSSLTTSRWLAPPSTLLSAALPTHTPAICAGGY